MTYFELVGGTGCPVCGPWVGTLATDGEPDEVTSTTLADIGGSGVFHDGCTHDWSEVSSERAETAAETRRAVDEWAYAFNPYDNDREKLTADAIQLGRLWRSRELTGAEKSALKRYSGGEFVDFNKALRGQGSLDSLQIELRETLDKLIAENRAPVKITVRRYADKIDSTDWDDREGLARLVGGEVSDSAFVSTTIADVGERRLLLEIDIPPGARATWMADESFYKHEAEVLLGRDARFVVQSFEELGDNKAVMRLRMEVD